jgi:hypothetical protein
MNNSKAGDPVNDSRRHALEHLVESRSPFVDLLGDGSQNNDLYKSSSAQQPRRPHGYPRRQILIWICGNEEFTRIAMLAAPAKPGMGRLVITNKNEALDASSRRRCFVAYGLFNWKHWRAAEKGNFVDLCEHTSLAYFPFLQLAEFRVPRMIFYQPNRLTHL